MSKDMLGIAVRKLVTLPSHTLGLVCDHLDKLADPEWVKATKLFLRKEQGWSGEPAPKFTLLVDLGIITVPDDYDHATHLASFKAMYRNDETKSFYYYNEHITDANFPNPSRILKPGDKLWVRAFQQVSQGTTTSVERMAFLDTQKAIHAGAQGASLVWEQKRDQLPKGKWYTSFDEEERLWQDADGNHRVPVVSARSDGDFSFRLGSFESVWGVSSAFLCFCDLPA